MNKPVAFIRQSKYGIPSLVWNGEFKYQSTVVKCDDIPLYTHPVKELTDEEIVTLMKVAQILLEKFGALTDERLAILRKAQATCNGFCGEYECKENQSMCKRKANEK